MIFYLDKIEIWRGAPRFYFFECEHVPEASIFVHEVDT